MKCKKISNLQFHTLVAVILNQLPRWITSLLKTPLWMVTTKIKSLKGSLHLKKIGLSYQEYIFLIQGR